MEARFKRAALLAAILTIGLVSATPAANYRTQHFVVTAATPEIARTVGEQAEVYRHDLAIEWLGRELPQWSQPCPISVTVGEQLGAGGATSFMFDRGKPFGWRMSIQGSYQRVLDSVLPHEVTHTIFATHFGQPLPRWADEGACTTVEHPSEKNKQHRNLIQFLQTGRGIAFNRMFAMKEYPHDVLPLYAQGFSVTRYLIQQGGKPHFVNFVAEGLRTNNWPAATQKFYGYRDLSDLQVKWNAWVAQGSPALAPRGPAVEAIASAQQSAAPGGATQGGVVLRGQSPDESASSQLAAVPSSAGLSAVQPRKDGLRWRARARRQREEGTNIPVPVEGPALVEQSTARQQSPQQPKTTILQWSAQPSASAAQTPVVPVSARPEATPGRSYYDRRGILGGRMKR